MDAPDQSEFLTLFIPIRHDLLAFLHSVNRDDQACEDCFQEISLVLWREFHRFDRLGSFGAWARGIAVNVVRQSWRRSARGPVLCEPATLQALAEAWQRTEGEADDLDERLARCTEGIEESQRQLLRLRYHEGLSLDGIAARLGRSMASINMTLSRLRRALQVCLDRKASDV
jgi:RNA polymerase sigma-70 factor (ECF subfamily)